MRYADPLAQAEIDRLRACSDPTPLDNFADITAEQLWHFLLESGSHQRIYALNHFLLAREDANRCFLEHGLALP
jgi:hypothetical protein